MDGQPTTLVLLRHGVTTSTDRKLFSGNGGADPALTEVGHEQAERAAQWIAARHDVDVVLSSPLLRTRETAAHVATATGCEVHVEPGVVEAHFGDWDGHGFADIMQRWPDDLQRWLDSTAVAPPGGESFDDVHDRVAEAQQRMLTDHAGRTVVVASHVTPIKMLVRIALGAPMSVIHTLELAPASITTIAWWPDGVPSVRNFSVVP